MIQSVTAKIRQGETALFLRRKSAIVKKQRKAMEKAMAKRANHTLGVAEEIKADKSQQSRAKIKKMPVNLVCLDISGLLAVKSR